MRGYSVGGEDGLALPHASGIVAHTKSDALGKLQAVTLDRLLGRLYWGLVDEIHLGAVEVDHCSSL